MTTSSLTLPPSLPLPSPSLACLQPAHDDSVPPIRLLKQEEDHSPTVTPPLSSADTESTPLSSSVSPCSALSPSPSLQSSQSSSTATTAPVDKTRNIGTTDSPLETPTPPSPHFTRSKRAGTAPHSSTTTYKRSTVHNRSDRSSVLVTHMIEILNLLDQIFRYLIREGGGSLNEEEEEEDDVFNSSRTTKREILRLPFEQVKQYNPTNTIQPPLSLLESLLSTLIYKTPFNVTLIKKRRAQGPADFVKIKRVKRDHEEGEKKKNKKIKTDNIGVGGGGVGSSQEMYSAEELATPCPGVCWDPTHQRWVAHWSDSQTHQRIRKYFNPKLLGFREARLLAMLTRKEAVESGRASMMIKSERFKSNTTNTTTTESNLETKKEEESANE